MNHEVRNGRGESETGPRRIRRRHKVNPSLRPVTAISVSSHYCKIIPSTLFAFSLYTANVKRSGQVLRENTTRTCVLAAEQTHPSAIHQLKINTTSACTDAPFHPSVSIHLLSVACLPPCMITRAVVKVLSTEWAVGSLASARVARTRQCSQQYRRLLRRRRRERVNYSNRAGFSHREWSRKTLRFNVPRFAAIKTARLRVSRGGNSKSFTRL